jgi:hypothetical protein
VPIVWSLLPQSSSSSRFTAGASAFFILSQSGERPPRTRRPFLGAITRKPSCLISCSHSLPEGQLSVLLGRHGAMKPAGSSPQHIDLIRSGNSSSSTHRRWPNGNPRSDAFFRSAPAVRFMAVAIFLTGDLLRECALSSRTSAFDQGRRLRRLGRLVAITHLSSHLVVEKRGRGYFITLLSGVVVVLTMLR